MPWLTPDKPQESCKCETPPEIFHSKVQLNRTTSWQCPNCFSMWRASFGKSFEEHVLGPNDYWYYFQLRQY